MVDLIALKALIKCMYVCVYAHSFLPTSYICYIFSHFHFFAIFVINKFRLCFKDMNSCKVIAYTQHRLLDNTKSEGSHLIGQLQDCLFYLDTTVAMTTSLNKLDSLTYRISIHGIFKPSGALVVCSLLWSRLFQHNYNHYLLFYF